MTRQSTILAAAAAGAVVVTVGAVLLMRNNNPPGPSRIERAFLDDLLGDAAKWLSSRMSRPPADIENDLRQLLAGRADAADGVQRIDYELSKESPTVVKRTVAVEFKKPDGTAIGRIGRQYQWEDLPREFRSEFIRNAGAPQARNLFERKA